MRRKNKAPIFFSTLLLIIFILMSLKRNLLIAALGLLITTAGVAGIASAAENNIAGKKQLVPNSAQHQAVQAAIEAGDYQAWQTAVGDAPIGQKITADNFSRFVEAHQLMSQARAIFDELGIDRPMMGGHHNGQGRGPEINAAIQTALDNNDYSAWLEAVGDSPITEKINADNFATFVQAHQLMKAGDHEGAKAIMDQLGLTPPVGPGRPHFNK